MTKILCCKSCGTVGEAGCDCGVGLEYISPGKLAAKAVADPNNVKKTNVELAEELGIDPETVRTARKNSMSENSEIGMRKRRNGKPYPAKPKRASSATDKAREVVRPIVEAGDPVSREKISEETGLPQFAIQAAVIAERARKEALQEEPQVTREMLSLSAQEKFDAAIRRESKRLERELDERAREMSRLAIEAMILPAYNREREEWREVIKRREGMMTKSQYNLIRACLHPDNSMTGEKRQRAWELFCELEITFLNEQDRPTSSFPIVKTFEELMELKRQRSAARRSGGKSVSLAS